MDPASQELQLQRAGVPRDSIHRDVGVSGSTGTQQRQGWHRLNVRLAGGDTLVVVAIDRIGRRWPDTIRSIGELRDRGVKVRSLAETEAQWTKYLEADEGSPEAFFGQVLTMFAAWVADQELESIKRRTREGLERARQQGKTLGPPRKLKAGQLEAVRRMREGEPACGGLPMLWSAPPAPSCGRCGGKESYHLIRRACQVDIAGGTNSETNINSLATVQYSRCNIAPLACFVATLDTCYLHGPFPAKEAVFQTNLEARTSTAVTRHWYVIY